MMLKTMVSGAVSLVFPMLTFAGDLGHASHDYFFSMSVAPSWITPGSTQTIALQPDVVDTYVPQNPNPTKVLANGEIFFGIQHPFFPSTQTQFGVALYSSQPARLKGFIQIDGNPDFQNNAYQYQINHQHLALKSKFIFEQAFNINPYVSAGVGVGFNRSYGYVITPLISQSVPMPAFQSNTETAFSYTVGVGFQRKLSPQLAVALGYQFVSWGASHLAPAPGQTSLQGLHLSHLYAEGIEFNFSYLL
jgi:hypothetical protein